MVFPAGQLVIDSRQIDTYYNPKGSGGYLPAALVRPTAVHPAAIPQGRGEVLRELQRVHNSDHWPNKGMPLRDKPIYEEDKLPTAGMSKRYRDALGLDELYKPHPRGWVPETFNMHEWTI